MIKKTVKYVDYEDVERTEDFYFNLNKVEIAEMEVSEEGGMAKKLERMVQTLDRKEFVEMFKDLILLSYGEKSPDGRRFIKTKEVREGFSQTEAYSVIFMELAENAEAAANFMNGIIPSAPNK